MSSEAFLALQRALDRYQASCQKEAQSFLQNRLTLRDCFELQKRHFAKDFLRNPINALWSIPYFSIRKICEASEKVGWDTGKSILQKVPQALKTDFQKEVEKLTASQVFGLGDSLSADRLACELEKESVLKQSMTERQWKDLLALARKQIQNALSESCSRQTGFSDLAATAGIFLFSELRFHDRTLDIFGIGRRVAGLWARDKAVSEFAFGKKLGKAFYGVVPAPPPSTSQIVLATAIGIAIVALFSTVVGMLSYPVQTRLGFRKKQLESLIDSLSDRLLIDLTKFLKKTTSQSQSA
jgi:hypothetical protein